MPSADAGSAGSSGMHLCFLQIECVPSVWRMDCHSSAPGIEHMLGLLMTFVVMIGLQEPANDLSGADALEQARLEKAGHLQQPTRTSLERALTQFRER